MKRSDVRRALRVAARVPVPPGSAEAEAEVVAQAKAAYAQVRASVSPARALASRRTAVRLAAACSVIGAAVIGGLTLQSPSQVEVRLGSDPRISPPAITPFAQPTRNAGEPGTTQPDPAPTAAASTIPAPEVTGAPAQPAPWSPPPSPAAPVPSPLPAESTGASRSPSPETPAYGYAGSTPEHRMSLGARIESDGVHVGWSMFDAGEFESYFVIRAEGTMPSWPLDEHSQVVARIPRGAPTNLVDSEAWSQRPVYRVVAVDDRRQEVGRSRAVTAEDRSSSSGENKPRRALP